MLLPALAKVRNQLPSCCCCLYYSQQPILSKLTQIKDVLGSLRLSGPHIDALELEDYFEFSFPNTV